MTFASDRLEQNQETLAKQHYDAQRNLHAARTSRFKFDPAAVMQLLNQRIVGQAPALAEIEQMLQVVKADFNHPERPLAVVLMLGSTGVGKTETVRLISEAIHGRNDAFCRIDMNTLAQEHYAAALTGAPPGYVGSKEGTTLFDIDAIQGSFSKPGIILFDELEKASKEVIRSLLNVLDNGKLTLSSGAKTIDFRNCMIFMTSNVGAKALQQQWGHWRLSLKHLMKNRDQYEQILIDDALQQQFDPEFLNRIDRILHYRRVKVDAIPALVKIEMDKLNQRLAKQGREVSLDAAVLQHLKQHYDGRYGARHLARQIRTQIEPIIAAYILQHPQVDAIQVHERMGEFVASPRENGASHFQLAQGDHHAKGL
ncbi:ClpA/ClpB-like protein [Acinetobacter calcoaceticus]|uniref:ClpA/ClpB-like protein n=1 Tax=Acinetobacter calcoaceticus TaxID=471 RepID=A0A4R1XZ85_ACICA|nr:ClpA/ClpB-like protein [Acinetobacter calcoaceticus]